MALYRRITIYTRFIPATRLRVYVLRIDMCRHRAQPIHQTHGENTLDGNRPYSRSSTHIIPTLKHTAKEFSRASQTRRGRVDRGQIL